MKSLAKKMHRFLVSEDGPTAVEYAVMLALIVVVCLTAITATQEETVLIELKSPRKPSAKPRSAQVPKPKRVTPARSSDLKVPEWAQ